MTMSSRFGLTSLLVLLPLVSAHGWVNSWVIDSVSRDGFVPSDVNRFPKSAERPTDNPTHGWAEPNDPIVACGGLSPGEGRETWDIRGGSSITVNWISDDRLQPNMVWPKEHVGAIMEYMAECPTGSCDGVDAASLQWFKISEQGVDGNGEWATDKLNRTRIWSFTIPDNIKTGAYLVRHELNAMHNPGAPQIYPVCFQAKVTSAGTGVPSDTVTFPNAYADFSQDFKEIDVQKEQKSGNAIVYTPPGPRVATFGTAQGTPDSSVAPIKNASGTAKVDSEVAPSSAPTISGISAPYTVPAAVTESTLVRSASTLKSEVPASSQTGSAIPPSSNRTHRGGRGSHRTRRACGA